MRPDCDRSTGWEFGRRAGAVSASGAAMIGFRDRGTAGLDIRVVGIPAVTVVIEFGGNELIVDSDARRQACTGFVSGFPTRTMRIRSERAECIEIRLSPIRAHSLLGLTPTDLVGDGIVGVEELWGRRALWLRERLADAGTWDERFALTESFLAHCAEPARTPDPEVVASWDRIVASRGQVRVAELAESCGWSRKRLWARFESQIGLTPKRATMLVRFRQAIEELVTGRPAADVAADCGYTDQSHLGRDLSSFADITPGTVTQGALTAFHKLRHQAWGTFFL
ncbi:helix-turn-helix domain-containing protein [Nocardia nepalensis]|uniref:helix-turn-helix domain-containing protein n=1 Tax=Nocardia nepalensis TaxID=3375448 RepID=UPI003B66E707